MPPLMRHSLSHEIPERDELSEDVQDRHMRSIINDKVRTTAAIFSDFNAVADVSTASFNTMAAIDVKEVKFELSAVCGDIRQDISTVANDEFKSFWK